MNCTVFKMKFIIALSICFTCIYYSTADIPYLPYCPETDSGLLIVSTLDGKISALNSSGSLVWEINTEPGPLLLSNIHNLELTNNGEWIRIIPSLTGTLYKFDGSTIDPIPITAEELLKSSFKYSDDLVIAGGIEVRTYGVGFRTGTFYYECNPQKCSNAKENDTDDVLVIERSTHIIRAVEPRTGNERWNFSVGLHDIKLSKINCINGNSDHFDWNVSAILPEGKLRASIFHNNIEESWNYIFTSPIVKIWKWTGKNLSEIDLFIPRHIPQIVSEETMLPSIYVGMHKKQLYIHESVYMKKNRRKPNTNVAVSESTSIVKIPWKPIPASRTHFEDDSTALSVLNASEYVNGQGFFLYVDSDLKETQNICDDNTSKINDSIHSKMKVKSLYFPINDIFYWRELLLMVATFFIALFLFKSLQRHEVIEKPAEDPSTTIIDIIEKPVEIPSTTNFEIIEKPVQMLSKTSVEHKEGEFRSRYVDEYETLRCLGRGGFGVVFEVKHKVDECSYAIKRITLPNKPKDRERVMREVKALAKLEHKNIVRYCCSWVERPPKTWQQEYDRKWLGDISTTDSKTTTDSKITNDSRIKLVTVDEDVDDSFVVFENENSKQSIHSKKSPFEEPPFFLYIQMQICKKESLKEWLSNHPERNYNVVIDIFFQILDAVEYVHLKELIHRDLKPGNILFALDGQVKVGDFGLVKEDVFDMELTKNRLPPSDKVHTAKVGTTLYMSPEQCENRTYDYKVDIYSLGLILFELLVPFSTEMERVVVLSRVKKHIYPEGFDKKFPGEYKLLKSMLHNDPNERLTTTEIKAKYPFDTQDSGYSDASSFSNNLILS